MSETRTTIIRLLSNMASAKEIQMYLRRFSQQDATRFAVVKVGGAILRDELEALVSSLAFLQQVGLTPVVVHGGGPQLDVELQQAGIEKQTVDGLRVTTPESLSIIRRVLIRENQRLVEALQADGVRASGIQTGVFEVDYLDKAKYGLVGTVAATRTEQVKSAIRMGTIPVISSLGETSHGQILNINADWAANALIKELQPYKIIFLTATGGLLDGQDRLIDSINLSSDFERLMSEPWLHSGMRVKIQQIYDLLMDLPLSSSVSITKPAELAKELFTHRGSGTLVRRGESILCFERWEDLDLPRLSGLIQSGFGRGLTQDYFASTQPFKIYVSEHYRAALVLTLENGVAHLDKFAVAEDAKGEGLGKAAWKFVKAQNPQMFWRSRNTNPINDFYFEEADGCIKGEPWNVFWYGLSDFESVQYAVTHCRERQATLKVEVE